MNKRLDKAFNLIRELNLDAIALYNGGLSSIDPNFIYFLGPTKSLLGGSYLIIEKNKAVILTSKLEKEAAKSLGLEVKVFEDFPLKKYVKRFRRIGVNTRLMSYSKVKEFLDLGILVVDVSSELEKLREKKSEEEIEAIRKAIEITEKAIKKVVDEGFSDKFESDVYGELIYSMTREGARLAFDPIVAFDENAAYPHYKTASNNKKPEKLVLIDVGANYNNYCADITRTFLLKRDKEIVEAYETVLEAQLKAIEKMKAGAIAGDIDKVARDIIEAKYPGSFIHSLGHMFGILVHEGRGLRRGANYKLEENMVFTVEPGVYFVGKYGIRIEDDVRVLKDGVEVLTTLPKNLEEVIVS